METKQLILKQSMAQRRNHTNIVKHLDEKENTTCRNLQHTVKAVVKGNSTQQNGYNKMQRISDQKTIFTSQESRKRRSN